MVIYSLSWLGVAKMQAEKNNFNYKNYWLSQKKTGKEKQTENWLNKESGNGEETMNTESTMIKTAIVRIE